jgi:hypothetical protein
MFFSGYKASYPGVKPAIHDQKMCEMTSNVFKLYKWMHVPAHNNRYLGTFKQKRLLPSGVAQWTSHPPQEQEYPDPVSNPARL